MPRDDLSVSAYQAYVCLWKTVRDSMAVSQFVAGRSRRVLSSLNSHCGKTFMVTRRNYLCNNIFLRFLLRSVSNGLVSLFLPSDRGNFNLVMMHDQGNSLYFFSQFCESTDCF